MGRLVSGGVSSVAPRAAAQKAVPWSRWGTSMTKWQTRLRCTEDLAGGLGELALGHGELLEIGADRGLLPLGEQRPGDVLVLAQPHGELGFPDDRQASLGYRRGFGGG